jgi:hypothetical protein
MLSFSPSSHFFLSMFLLTPYLGLVSACTNFSQLLIVINWCLVLELVLRSSGSIAMHQLPKGRGQGSRTKLSSSKIGSQCAWRSFVKLSSDS